MRMWIIVDYPWSNTELFVSPVLKPLEQSGSRKSRLAFQEIPFLLLSLLPFLVESLLLALVFFPLSIEVIILAITCRSDGLSS